MSRTPDSDPRPHDDTVPPRPDTENDATVAPRPADAGTLSRQGTVAGYELIDELGRGGMGVVYRARDTNLDRIVALKMILGGQFVSEEAIRRFKLEAESVARLDHPNIVPIFEVGEVDNKHFYTMKLIDGSSLSERLEDYQPDNRLAAQLMIDIARAVHHAHERGVLHRDLKPANVLIDDDGNPLITDLGLAKQMDDESGLTQTGLVMGSPGFMAPEQAAGKTDVTTGVDIYALGAMLYWLIAGRPPFVGDTHLDVILKTINERPESVRSIRADADRDLNLICLKALEKKPEDRYPSAAAFADDLQAWLDGNPLSVKPPTAYELTRLWIRKNMRTVTAASLAGALCGLAVGFIVLMLIVDGTIGSAKAAQSQLGESSTAWIVRYFSWVDAVPDWIIRTLPPFIVWISVGIGIGMIGLIKPKNREVGMVAAITAGLLAGILAYTISLGWAPMSQHAVNRGVHDIQLISDSMWVQSDRERELARQALVQRYPGLDRLKSQSRGDVVYRKIIRDQTLGIPKGMWVGIGSTLCLCVLPLFFTAVFAGLIWDRGARGWQFFGKSIELGIYSSLIFLVGTKWISFDVGPSPGNLIQLLTIAGLMTALFFGLKDWDWQWRIAGFLIANVVVFWNFHESGKINRAVRIASQASSVGEQERAVQCLQKRVDVTQHEYDRYLLCVLYAYLGRDEDYARECRNLREVFTNIYRPDVGERMAKVNLLKPHLLGDLAFIHQTAELVSGYDSFSAPEWLYFCRALSEARQGNLQSTITWNQKVRDEVDKRNPGPRGYLLASTHLVDAIAYRFDGRTDLSDQQIQAAQRTLEDHADRLGDWPDNLVYEILRREAESN